MNRYRQIAIVFNISDPDQKFLYDMVIKRPNKSGFVKKALDYYRLGQGTPMQIAQVTKSIDNTEDDQDAELMRGLV
ncbi:hypothetical protein [Mechercharimyces sp. CAU 1602]|uniref:hypothetical protein n=1 Tax=Mechercharimyces sp. CAU 1602 TaxID=2973933 RepID=UPI002162F3D1|nr:hypothetical protein [Mechercharimyces sp. CAU 1602]MCS1350335.1 hypothetical protein [Mechercharimyces sp. CAU 1602]